MPRITNTPEKVILLSFLLWGAAHVLMESRYDETVMLDTLARVARQTIALIND